MDVDKRIKDIIEELEKTGVQINVRRLHFEMYEPKSQMSQVLSVLLEKPIWNDSYDKIALWCKDNQGTGLMLTGKCGVGKTLLATKVLPILMYRNFKITFSVFSASEINCKENDVLTCKYKVIDDVGVEDAKHDYGEVRHVFAEVVDKAERCGDTLILTTNLTAEDIMDKYGERTFDRLRALTRVISIEGESKRQSANVKTNLKKRQND